MAKLYFKYGAMGSSKTANALITKFNYEERGMHVAVLKPGIDTKAESRIQSRIGLEREVDHLIQKGENVYQLFKEQEEKPLSIFQV